MALSLEKIPLIFKYIIVPYSSNDFKLNSLSSPNIGGLGTVPETCLRNEFHNITVEEL